MKRREKNMAKPTSTNSGITFAFGPWPLYTAVGPSCHVAALCHFGHYYKRPRRNAATVSQNAASFERLNGVRILANGWRLSGTK
jgi:hypothetical protein